MSSEYDDYDQYEDPPIITEDILLLLIDEIDNITRSLDIIHTYSFLGTHADNFKDENCKIIIGAIRSDFTRFDDWLDNPDTDLKIFKTLIILPATSVAIMPTLDKDDFKKLSKKKITNMNLYWFKHFLIRFHIRTLDDDDIDTLIEWYEPFSDSGVLHWELFDGYKFKHFVHVSEKYPFDVNKMGDTMRINFTNDAPYHNTKVNGENVVISYDYLLKHLQEETLETLCHNKSHFIYLATSYLQNNYEKLLLNEKTQFINFLRLHIKSNTHLITVPEIIDIFRKEIKDSIQTNNIPFIIYISNNFIMFDFIIEIMIEENKSLANIEYNLISNGSEMMLKHYYGEFTQETIISFAKKYGDELSI